MSDSNCEANLIKNPLSFLKLSKIKLEYKPMYAKKINIMLHNDIPRTMTDVVPSPTSSSCVRLNSIMDWHDQPKQIRTNKTDKGVNKSIDILKQKKYRIVEEYHAFAAGCARSNSRRMAFPSLVTTIPGRNQNQIMFVGNPKTTALEMDVGYP